MKILTANDLFRYLRGAIRSAYGTEDLRGKSVLFIGMYELGQELLEKFCMDGVNLYFTDNSVGNYYKAHTICPFIKLYKEEPVDIVLDFEVGIITLKGKHRSFLHIPTQDAYDQGIHDFYLE